MKATEIIPIDLQFLGNPEAIAAFLIPHHDGAALVESGPASTLPVLEEGLRANGFKPEQITDLLLTHIHLDHAGAAGDLARRGARVHVHEVGAPHLVDPSRLLASAGRIYGDQMDRLWGKMTPIPRKQVYPLRDGARIQIGGLVFTALDTPGHANHHMAYLLGSTCFSGDVGGVRRPGLPHLELPLPPPEVDLEKWSQSLARIEEATPEAIAPTHFGIFNDVAWHLGSIKTGLDKIARWLRQTMDQPLTGEEFRARFSEWARAEAQADGLSASQIEVISSVNPTWMSADGLFRYWDRNLKN